MTVIAKNILYGVDRELKLLQDYINDNLDWEGDYKVFGLAQKVETENGIIPEIYVGSDSNNLEYSQIFIDDTITGTVGFIEQGDRTLGVDKSITIDMIVTVRLDEAYPTITERVDEYMIMKMELILNAYYGGRHIAISAKKGIREVFSGFYIENIKYNDIQPWLVFSIRFNLPYFNINKCISLL